MQRFRVSHPYDPEMDPATWKGYKPYGLKGWKAEQTHYKSGQSASRRAVERRADPQWARRKEAEDNLADAIRAAVRAVEMAMVQLKEAPLPKGFPSYVSQFSLQKAIVLLRTMCGVKFTDADRPTDYLESVQPTRKHHQDGYETEYERRKRLEREESVDRNWGDD